MYYSAKIYTNIHILERVVLYENPIIFGSTNIELSEEGKNIAHYKREKSTFPERFKQFQLINFDNCSIYINSGEEVYLPKNYGVSINSPVERVEIKRMVSPMYGLLRLITEMANSFLIHRKSKTWSQLTPYLQGSQFLPLI